jgi:hypothetical protein
MVFMWTKLLVNFNWTTRKNLVGLFDWREISDQYNGECFDWLIHSPNAKLRGMLRLIGHNIPSNQTHHPVKQTIQPIKNDFYYCRAMLRGGSTLLSGRGLTDGMRSILLDPLAFS